MKMTSFNYFESVRYNFFFFQKLFVSKWEVRRGPLLVYTYQRSKKIGQGVKSKNKDDSTSLTTNKMKKRRTWNLWKSKVRNFPFVCSKKSFQRSRCWLKIKFHGMVSSLVVQAQESVRFIIYLRWHYPIVIKLNN